MLDELAGTLLECQLAMRSMLVDVGLTLDELERDLRRARESTRLAYGAASLLRQRADLAGSWTDYPSRPKAIHARHRVAVDYGAPPKVPAVPTADRYEETLQESYEQMLKEARESPAKPAAAGGRCAYTECEGKSCRRRAVRIGLNEFADRCPDHLGDGERELYEHHRREAAARIAKAQRDEISRIADDWIVQRRGLRSWVQQVIRTTGWVG